MASVDLEKSKPDETLDVLGEICPYPQIYTRSKLESMKQGQILEVITDHPPAAEETIPGLCKTMRYPFIVRKQGPVYRIRILKEASS